jgi:acetyl-CoA carboxylase alpha subunit
MLAKRTFLDFEQPIAELESKIEELRYVQTESPSISRRNRPAQQEEPAAHQGHLQPI